MNLKSLHKITLMTAALFMASASVCSAELKVDYLYNLANFEGIVPYSWAGIFVDKKYDEIYVCHTDGVSIFNSAGMEVYTFGDDNRLGNIGGGAILDEKGDMLLLTSHNQRGTYVRDFTVCDFRGEPISKFTLKDVPQEFAGFAPDRVIRRGDKLYFAEFPAMRAIVTDLTGKYLEGYDIASIMGMSEKLVRDSGLTGFNVDRDGNIFYTIAVLFRAYEMTPDRKVSSWGEPGGAPGRFNVIAGIDTDDKGNIYVVDTLKASVIVFNKDHRFVTQFGERGWDPGDLIAPSGVVIDGKGKIYVSQAASRGINVYKLND